MFIGPAIHQSAISHRHRTKLPILYPSLLILLLSHFALPFTVLSTTAVVVQSWMARSYLGQTVEPYPLYAASNAGSLIGLFSYPFLFEPFMGVRMQSFVWASCYIVVMYLMSMTFYVLRSGQKKELTSSVEGPKAAVDKTPLRSTYGIWLIISALPSALLLTVTSFISMEIGSFPMIWILPLASYLASFIVTFRTGAKIPEAAHNTLARNSSHRSRLLLCRT